MDIKIILSGIVGFLVIQLLIRVLFLRKRTGLPVEELKKAEVAILTVFILFLAPMAVYAGNGVDNSTLGPNEKLRVPEELISKNGQYALKMQEDGNLVCYDSQRKALWSSRTDGSGAIECIMQSDGNLLLKDKNGRVVWATNTDGYPNATFLIEDDGNVVLYQKGERGAVFWSNGKIIIERIKYRLSKYNANTGDKEFDDKLLNLNDVAYADLDNFMNKLSDTFNVSTPWIENLVKRENIPPADVYMIARTASVINQSIDTVEKKYRADRGQGWGVIAKRLGIKPGSKEFHALKKDDKGLLSKEKSQGQKKKD